MKETGNENPKLGEEAFAAQEWFMAQVKERGLTLPADFPGLKNLIIHMTLAGKNRGKSPQEMAESYLAKLAGK